MSDPTRDPRIDDLRQQLRSLGYLDAGVDRFLLAPARAARGPWSIAGRSAIRVGLLGGVLLGPAAAVGLGAWLPGLIDGVRDAAVLAFYLAALFFVAITLISLTVSLLCVALVRVRDDRFPRRARRVSGAAGWGLTVACLLYLTLWWGNAGFGWSAPARTAFALAVAVAISLLLGHAVRITALAVLAAAAGPATSLPPSSTRSWRVVMAGAIGAFSGAAALLVWTTSLATPAPADHLPLTVVSTSRTLRLIAIDGFDPAVAKDLHLARLSLLMASIAVALEPQDTSDPARAWTTIATGVPPAVHGVHSIETRRVAGVRGILTVGGGTLGRVLRTATDLARLTRPSVASREERRVKTIWEVAGDAGLRTAVVNWWATWPATGGSGIVISDRAVLRLEQGGALDAEISPANLYPALQLSWPAVRRRARESAASAFAETTDLATVTILRRSAELDSTIIGLARALPGPARDLDVMYLPGLDIAQHALLGVPEGGAPAASTMAARLDALRSYYRYLDDALGVLLVPKDREIVMVVTQPGRVQSSANGMLAVALADVSINPKADLTARVEDLAPTVLDALGLPLSRELPGQSLRPLNGLVLEEQRYVSTYGRPFAAPSAREGRPLDQEMIDRLRSLGYVK